jgi:hypothetical protein
MEQLPIFALGGGALLLLGAQAFFFIHLWRQQQRLLARFDELELHLTGHVSETAVKAKPSVSANAVAQKSPGKRKANDNRAAPVPSTRVGVGPGDPVPALTFRDFNDKAVALADFQGSNTLLLFWNPSCGFCKGMLATLQAWGTHRTESEPMLLVISSGTAHENRLLNLRSPVVCDEGGNAGTLFGIKQTPMGLLVDAGGKTASKLAGGSQAIMALARSTVAQAQAREGGSDAQQSRM